MDYQSKSTIDLHSKYQNSPLYEAVLRNISQDDFIRKQSRCQEITMYNCCYCGQPKKAKDIQLKYSRTNTIEPISSINQTKKQLKNQYKKPKILKTNHLYIFNTKNNVFQEIMNHENLNAHNII